MSTQHNDDDEPLLPSEARAAVLRAREALQKTGEDNAGEHTSRAPADWTEATRAERVLPWDPA